MSNLNQQWSNLNPPPPAPTIPGSANFHSVDIGKGDFRAHWPTKIYVETLELGPGGSDPELRINFPEKPFNYGGFTVNEPNSDLIITNVPRGHIFVFEIMGSETLSITMDTQNISLSAGTYLITLFSNALKYSEFTNPTAL